MLPATLAQHLGLPELLRRDVRLGKVDGAANPERKALIVRQLDAVQEDLLQRAWEAGARPQEAVLGKDLTPALIALY